MHTLPGMGFGSYHLTKSSVPVATSNVEKGREEREIGNEKSVLGECTFEYNQQLNHD